MENHRFGAPVLTKVQMHLQFEFNLEQLIRTSLEFAQLLDLLVEGLFDPS